MRKVIQDKSTGKWYTRWPYHKGYIFQTYVAKVDTTTDPDYVGAALRQGRQWAAVVGGEDDDIGTFTTLAAATDAILRSHARGVQ